MWTRSTSAPHKHPAGGGPYIENSTRHNHMMNSMGPIFSCNPCGEQFLHSNNSCNLGSIDVSKFCDPLPPPHYDGINWDRLRHVVRSVQNNMFGFSQPRNETSITPSPKLAPHPKPLP